MSKCGGIVLDEKQIYEVKKLVSETRRFFGVQTNVPIGNDIRLLLEKKDILLCEYPFPDTNGTHTYGNITWFKNGEETITFIGLNTSSYYDEQIFVCSFVTYVTSLMKYLLKYFLIHFNQTVEFCVINLLHIFVYLFLNYTTKIRKSFQLYQF